MGPQIFSHSVFPLVALFLLIFFEVDAIAQSGAKTVLENCRGSRGKQQEAIADCTAIIEGRTPLEDSGELVLVHYYRAVHLRALNRRTEAIADLSAALQIDPSFVRAQALRGRVWKELDNCESGYPDLVVGVRATPRDESFLIDAAICALETKKYDHSLVLNRAVIALNRRNPVPRMNLASTYLAMGSLREALKAYDEALARPVRIEQSDISRVHVQKGIIYIALNELELALQSYTRAIQHDPKNRNAYIRRAYLHAHTGRNELAEADLMSANRTSAK